MSTAHQQHPRSTTQPLGDKCWVIPIAGLPDITLSNILPPTSTAQPLGDKCWVIPIAGLPDITLSNILPPTSTAQPLGDKCWVIPIAGLPDITLSNILPPTSTAQPLGDKCWVIPIAGLPDITLSNILPPTSTTQPFDELLLAAAHNVLCAHSTQSPYSSLVHSHGKPFTEAFTTSSWNYVTVQPGVQHLHIQLAVRAFHTAGSSAERRHPTTYQCPATPKVLLYITPSSNSHKNACVMTN